MKLKQTTVRLPEDLEQLAKRKAEEEGTTFSVLVREGLELRIQAKKLPRDPLFTGAFVGACKVPIRDGSRNYRKHLYGGRKP